MFVAFPPDEVCLPGTSVSCYNIAVEQKLSSESRKLPESCATFVDDLRNRQRRGCESLWPGTKAANGSYLRVILAS
ncbi:MAG TPA: hypothetical protein VM715_17725, partial [Candidatus Acidoferrum sp.]|nr:hypothetical protein [Candidatus Acidoferrum sp.]